MAATKAKEKEMKDEKEAERQVSCGRNYISEGSYTNISTAEEDNSYQGEEGQERGEGSIREVGGDDAQEAGGEVKEEGEEEQDVEILTDP